MSLWRIKTADNAVSFVEAGPIEDALQVHRECAEKAWDSYCAAIEDEADAEPPIPFEEMSGSIVRSVELYGDEVYREGWEPDVG